MLSPRQPSSYDIGGGAFEPDWFEAYFQGAAANGSNTARVWLHCDGRQVSSTTKAQRHGP